MTAGTTVWPNDAVIDAQELIRDSPHSLVRFLLSPFEPREVFGEIHSAVALACGVCAQSAGIEIECGKFAQAAEVCVLCGHSGVL